MSLNRKKVQGLVMAAIGGMILLVNAVAYIFSLGFGKPYLTIFGILFVGTGMAMVRRN